MCFLYYFNILHLLWLIAQQHCCSGLKVEMSDLFCWFQRKWGNVRIYFHRACIRSIFTCRYLFGTANSLSWKLVATLCMLLLKEYEWYSHVQPTKQASQSSAWCHTCFVKTVMTDVCEVLTFYSAIYLCCFYYLIQSNTICMQGGFNIIYEPPGCSSESYHDDIIQTKLKSWQIFYTLKHIYIYIYMAYLGLLSYLTTMCFGVQNLFLNVKSPSNSAFRVSPHFLPHGCPQLESFELGGVAYSPWGASGMWCQESPGRA